MSVRQQPRRANRPWHDSDEALKRSDRDDLVMAVWLGEVATPPGMAPGYERLVGHIR